MKLHNDQDSIYRIYNYNALDNFGEYDEINGDVKSKLLFEPSLCQVLFNK